MQEDADGTLRKISIDDVEIGMVLEDVFNAQGVLLLSSNISVFSQEQIDTLRKRGVVSVFINTKTGKDVAPGKQVLPFSEEEMVQRREQEYYKELSRAKEVHKITLEKAREALSSVRMGKQFAAKDLEQSAQNIVESILRNPDALVSLSQIKGYDEYTYEHSVNVGILITSLAHSIGYRDEMLLWAGVGGLLHDIGKMRIPEPILNKSGKYTDAEFAVMKRHPDHGIDILKNYRDISDLSKKVVIQHHERYNGKGYPRGLEGDNIHEIGLIAAVSDVYDAMTTDRVYRAAWTPQKALALIFQGCDTEYSRNIVERFTKHLGIYPVGSFVQLFNGERGIVIRVDKGMILAPDVLILFSSDGTRRKRPVEYKLARKQKEEQGEEFRIKLSLNPKEYNVDVREYINANPFD